jgi:hypothetical protein
MGWAVLKSDSDGYLQLALQQGDGKMLFAYFLGSVGFTANETFHIKSENAQINIYERGDHPLGS